MRHIFILTLLALIACENNDINKEILFSGQVIETDSPDNISLQGVKLDLKVPTTSLSKDSTLYTTTTDSKGRYLFSIKDLDEQFEFYKIEISEEYYKNCIELPTSDMTPFGHKTIKRHSENIWDLNACITGKVETNVTRQSILTKDTINIIVSTKRPDGSYSTDLNPILVTASKQWTMTYYYNVVRSVKYLMELKKENGEIISWTEEKELKPKAKIQFEIEF